MTKDITSIPRTTKRIGSLRYFILHRGTSRKNWGKASTKQVNSWKAQLKSELALRETLRKKEASKTK